MTDYYVTIESRLIGHLGDFSASERLLATTADSSTIHKLASWDTERSGIAMPKIFTTPVLAAKKFEPDQPVFRVQPATGTLLPGVREKRIKDIISSTHSVYGHFVEADDKLMIIRDHHLRIELDASDPLWGDDISTEDHANKIYDLLENSGTMRAAFAVRHLQRSRKAVIEVYYAHENDRTMAAFVLKTNGLVPR